MVVAWCENTKHFSTLQLGKEIKYGIFKAEFVGLILALRLVKHSITSSTRQATIILENQGVVEHMASKKMSSRACTQKIQATGLINDIEELSPHLKIALRCCPGHTGIKGNEEADKRATNAAKKPLHQDHVHKPKFSSFRAAIKDWEEKKTLLSYTAQDQKRLDHQPHPKEHMKALMEMKNKHSVSLVTQLCTGHIPLYHYLASRSLRADSTCACGMSPETVKHFLFDCPIHDEPRQELQQELDKLNIPFNRMALHYPSAMVRIANFTSSTWQLRSRWEWAKIMDEASPRDKHQPD